MSFKKTATDIIKNVGGDDNIVHLEHCSTRLRFNLADRSKVDVAALEKVPGVLKVLNNAQCQVVIGNNIVEVYDEVNKQVHIADRGVEVKAQKNDQKLGARFMDFIIGVFQPLVPAIAGAGILKSLLLLLSMLHWLPTTNSIYMVLASISDAAFYFLPIMVAITTANYMKTNRLVAVAAVGFLLLPATTTMLSNGLVLFGITVRVIAYNAQVFPAILSVVFLSYMERLFNKISPKAIRIFFVPMMSLAITIPVTLLFLGPLGFIAGQGLSTFIVFVHDKIGFLALALLAGILPFMIATGMHKAMIPYAVAIMGELGYETLYLVASLGHNISEAGACFAVSIRTKNKDLKSTAVSAGISALMGITEPALYGVTLQNKRALIGVISGGVISGGFLGIMAVRAFALVGPGLASITMFADAANPMNLFYAALGAVIALVVSFAIVFIVWKDDENKAADVESHEDVLVAPLKGVAIDLSEVKDDMFSQRSIGDGVAIIPSEGVLYAPIDGTITMVFATKHALGMKTENGTEILFHIGMETVQLNGKGFETFVKENDVVHAGDVLIKFDLAAIKAAGLDPVTPIVVTNTNHYDLKNLHYGEVSQGDQLFSTLRKA